MDKIEKYFIEIQHPGEHFDNLVRQINFIQDEIIKVNSSDGFFDWIFNTTKYKHNQRHLDVLQMKRDKLNSECLSIIRKVINKAKNDLSEFEYSILNSLCSCNRFF